MRTQETVDVDDVEAGDKVTVEFSKERGAFAGRKTFENVPVTEKTGEILYLDEPYPEDLPGVTLVLDPEGDLWARDEKGRDGFYGSNTRITGVNAL